MADERFGGRNTLHTHTHLEDLKPINVQYPDVDLLASCLHSLVHLLDQVVKETRIESF